MERVAAFAFMGFVLIVASDFPATASIAVAFSYLILLAVLMAVGPIAFARLSALFGSQPGSATAPVTSPSRARPA